jgi:Phage tail assembly chaperone protein
MKVAIVLLDSLQIPCLYDAPEPSQGSYGGDWGSPQVTIHLGVPDGLDPQCLMAVRDPEGNVTLVTDPAKVTQKTANQWSQVRVQQKQKLYESDWTCSVTDYEVPNKAEWVTYRQALRDVTKQSDPFAIVWPSPPA